MSHLIAIGVPCIDGGEVQGASFTGNPRNNRADLCSKG